MENIFSLYSDIYLAINILFNNAIVAVILFSVLAFTKIFSI